MINAHGGNLVNLQNFSKLKDNNLDSLKSYVIDDRFVSDCEMIANGGFSPLKGFMNRDEIVSVLDNLTLKNGLLWSIPIMLPLKDLSLNLGDKIILKDSYNRKIALMEIEDIFNFDFNELFQKMFGTTDENHPGIKILKKFGNSFVGGKIELLQKPFRNKINSSYYLDPSEVRRNFKEREFKSVVAFQTRNPIHRAHEHIIKSAMETHCAIFIHPLVGATKEDDIPEDIRMKCYEVLIKHYFSQKNTFLSVLPAAMRYAGPKEAIHHLIIRKNYGCTHMIIGRDHAGVGDYYGTYDAQKLVLKYLKELEITPILFDHSFFCLICNGMASQKTCPHPSKDHVFLSGTKVRSMLKEGFDLPIEFTRFEVSKVLKLWVENE